MGRRTLLLIASILVAATGTGVVALYAKSADQRAGDAQKAGTVLVATGTIKAGTAAKDLQGLVRTRSFAQGLIPPDALTSLSQTTGLVTSTTIAAGQPLQRSLFVTADNQQASNPLGLAKDKIAVSVTMPDNGRVAGYVTDNSYVALYVLEGTQGQGGQGSQIELIIGHSVHVLKVEAFKALGPTQGSTLVTLELSQEEAPRVIFASQKDLLYMALLPDKDVNLQDLKPFTGNYTGTDS